MYEVSPRKSDVPRMPGRTPSVTFGEEKIAAVPMGTEDASN
jgi:hypothetical protein